MKRDLPLFAGLAAIISCTHVADYDASGAFEATEITVSAEVSGRIVSFDTDEGATVSKDQTVCRIDSTALVLQRRTLEQQQRALLSGKPDTRKQLGALKEQISKQKTELARVEALYKEDAATAKQVDDARAQLSILQGQYDATLSSLGKSAASIEGNAAVVSTQMDQLDYSISKCQVTAPAAGTIVTKYAQEGEVTAAGKPLFKLADLENMFLRAYFTSDQLSSVTIGQQVRVVADFGGKQQIEYPGTVTWISSESEFTPKSIQTRDSRAALVYAVKIAVKNDGRLKIGFYGEVHLGQ